jgi:hypothetical protein
MVIVMVMLCFQATIEHRPDAGNRALAQGLRTPGPAVSDNCALLANHVA